MTDFATGTDDEEYDSEEESIGVKKFMPINIPKDFDPNKVPTTGEEYLHYVMYEARNCDAVVTANIKHKKNDVYIMEVKAIPKCHPDFLPTKEWNQNKLAQFVEFRKYIHSMLPKELNKQWESTYMLSKINSDYPKFSDVYQLSGNTLFNFTIILSDQLKEIGSGGIPNQLGVWIYTVLTLLQIPLLSDHCYYLRNIAEDCARLRSLLPSDSSSKMYDPLNFFICIIGLGFGQSDLVNCSD